MCMKRIHPEMAEVIYRLTRHGNVPAKEIARRLRDDFGLNVSHKYLLSLTDKPHANDAERPFKGELLLPFMAAAESRAPLDTLNRVAEEEYRVPVDMETARRFAVKEAAEAVAATYDESKTPEERRTEWVEGRDSLTALIDATDRYGG